jgi:hypothetical protein
MVEMSRAVDGVYIRVQPWANQQGGAGKIKPGMNFVSRAEREREEELFGWYWAQGSGLVSPILRSDAALLGP